MAVSANYEFHIRIVSAMTWLCSAFQHSKNEEIHLSDVLLRKVEVESKEGSTATVSEKGRNCNIFLLLNPLKQLGRIQETGSNNTCWHGLFRNAVIAHDYPIPAWKVAEGLEITFSNMVVWARCLKAIQYNNGLFMDGLGTMLVPIKELIEDDALQWHLIEKVSESEAGFGSDLVFRSASELFQGRSSQDWHEDLELENLLHRRAFLGWTGQAEILMGTKSVHAVLECSGAYEAKAGWGHPYVKSLGAALGSSGLGILGGTIAATIEPSHISRYAYIKGPTWLDDRLRNATSSYSVIYDTSVGIAWYVSQASIILHVALFLVQSREYFLFRDRGMKEVATIQYAQPCTHDGSAAFKAIYENRKHLVFSRNPVTQGPGQHLGSFENMIENIYHSISCAKVELSSIFSSPQRGTKTAPKWILGFEWIDVAEERDIWKVKEHCTNQPWTHLAEECGLVLFCSGIGQIIAPVNANSLCEIWQRVPPHEDYLVACGPAVQCLISRNSNACGVWLSDRVKWDLPNPLNTSFNCEPELSRSHTQKLCSAKKRQGLNRQYEQLKVNPEAGYIFHRSTISCIDRKHFSKPRQVRSLTK